MFTRGKRMTIVLLKKKKQCTEAGVQKVTILPSVFTKMLELYKERQDEIKRRKIIFLTQQAYQYYYDMQEGQERKPYGIDLPEFILRKQAEKNRRQFAEYNAAQVMLQVIADGRVDECYRKRIKEFLKRR